MKIKQIQIKNFMGIEELSLEFKHPDGNPSDMVVLAGPNGCGKTSVIEACILALGSDKLLPNLREESQFIRKGSEQFEISIKLAHNGQEYNIKRTETGTGDIGSALEQIKVEYFSSRRYPKLTGSLSVNVGKERTADKIKNRYYKIKQYLINLKASKAFDDDYVSPAEDDFDKINELWKNFYPGRNEQFVAKKISDDISEGFDIFLDGREQKPVPLDSLSSGEIEIFTLIGQSIIKPLSNGIIFIDEPELHLHSSWHRVILRVLRKIFPKNQIICATHSQEILDSVYSYERFTLIPEQDPRIRLNKSVSVNGE
ncbi:MAG: ATP-binding protein [Desulfobacterales bacterium]|nr:ATP-binding protein [Desulfobacterales bacterium]